MFNSVNIKFVKCVDFGSHVIEKSYAMPQIETINKHLTTFYNNGKEFRKFVFDKYGRDSNENEKCYGFMGYLGLVDDEDGVSMVEGKNKFLHKDVIEMMVRVIKKNKEDKERICGIDDPEFFEALYELDTALAQQGQGGDEDDEGNDGLEYRVQLIIY